MSNFVLEKHGISSSPVVSHYDTATGLFEESLLLAINEWSNPAMLLQACVDTVSLHTGFNYRLFVEPALCDRCES